MHPQLVTETENQLVFQQHPDHELQAGNLVKLVCFQAMIQKCKLWVSWRDPGRTRTLHHPGGCTLSPEKDDMVVMTGWHPEGSLFSALPAPLAGVARVITGCYSTEAQSSAGE